MYTVTINRKTAIKDGTILLDIVITTNDPTNEDPNLFCVEKLSKDNETATFTNCTFLSVASPDDKKQYDTIPIYPGIFRSCVIRVASPSPTKRNLFFCKLMKDIETATGIAAESEDVHTPATEFTYHDTGDITGPFLFAQK